MNRPPAASVDGTLSVQRPRPRVRVCILAPLFAAAFASPSSAQSDGEIVGSGAEIMRPDGEITGSNEPDASVPAQDASADAPPTVPSDADPPSLTPPQVVETASTRTSLQAPLDGQDAPLDPPRESDPSNRGPRRQPPSAEDGRMSWLLAGSMFGVTLGVGFGNLVLRNLPSRTGPAVVTSLATLVGIVGLGALAGLGARRGADKGWNADVGATLASMQAFGWLGAALGSVTSELAGATPRVQLISTIGTGIGAALLATLLQALAVSKRGGRALPSLAAAALALLGGGAALLISGIAASEHVGRSGLLGASLLGLAGGVLGFALAI